VVKKPRTRTMSYIRNTRVLVDSPNRLENSDGDAAGRFRVNLADHLANLVALQLVSYSIPATLIPTFANPDRNGATGAAIMPSITLTAQAMGLAVTRTVFMPSTRMTYTSFLSYLQVQFNALNAFPGSFKLYDLVSGATIGPLLRRHVRFGILPSADHHTVISVEYITYSYRYDPVYVATTGNITLSGLQVVDGVATFASARVLVKGQTNPVQNGVYTAAAGTWSRAALDFAVGFPAGSASIYVVAGALSGEHDFLCTNAQGSDIIGTDPLTFVLNELLVQVAFSSGLSFSGSVAERMGFVAGQTYSCAVASNDVDYQTAQYLVVVPLVSKGVVRSPGRCTVGRVSGIGIRVDEVPDYSERLSVGGPTTFNEPVLRFEPLLLNVPPVIRSLTISLTIDGEPVALDNTKDNEFFLNFAAYCVDNTPPPRWLSQVLLL
jgi:hypothetical protein